VKKNLLTSIQACTETAAIQETKNSPSADAMQVVLDIMEARLERVANVVHNMSMPDGKCSNKQSYDINACIKNTTNKLAQQLPSTVTVELTLAQLPFMYIDTYKICQLLTNLITNANKAIQTNGSIVISSKLHCGNIEIEVADNGCGIQKHLQEIIFDPSFSTHKAADGTGLGLAISRDIAIEHGGTLQVSSEPNKGSVFTLTIPVAEIVIH
jgi:signal transduction histidine kinase